MKRGASGINCLIGVDKPAGISSHDVVARLRKATGEGRIGHAGTLDPAATGVLVVGIGQATRLMSHLSQDRKSYIARISFGRSTTTDDAEGETLEHAAIPSSLFQANYAQGVIANLVGSHKQLPPDYSAVSVGGQRAYKLARKGENPQLCAREIEIYSAQLLSLEADHDTKDLSWDCAFEVSKGCYIRSIARDLGQSLGTAAHLSELCRTSSGKVSIASCKPLEEIEATLKRAAEQGIGAKKALEASMIDPLVALDLPSVLLSDAQASRAATGAALHIDELNIDTALPAKETHKEALHHASDELYALVHREGLVGIWKRSDSKLVCSVNFSQGIGGLHHGN